MKKLSAQEKGQVRKTVASLDRIASYIEDNYKQHGWTKQKGMKTALELNRIAVMLEDAVKEDWHDDVDYLTSPDTDMDGMEMEPDEPYMDTFVAPTALHEGDADEESYMDWYNNNDNMEVMEYVEEDRRESGNSVQSSSRRKSLWKEATRFLQATEEDEEEAEDHDEEHEASMRRRLQSSRPSRRSRR